MDRESLVLLECYGLCGAVFCRADLISFSPVITINNDFACGSQISTLALLGALPFHILNALNVFPYTLT